MPFASAGPCAFAEGRATSRDGAARRVHAPRLAGLQRTGQRVPRERKRAFDTDVSVMTLIPADRALYCAEELRG